MVVHDSLDGIMLAYGHGNCISDGKQGRPGGKERRRGEGVAGRRRVGH